MKCLNTIELERFLAGTLPARELVAIDEHVCSCERCKDALAALPARAASVAGLGTTVLGVEDCPEYEELSEFVDGTLEKGAARSMSAHVNSCSLCARDVESLREMRSHAAMRDRIEVAPSTNRSASSRVFVYWKRALAGVSLAAVVALALAFGYFGRAPSPVQDVAVKPPVANVKPEVDTPPVPPKPDHEIVAVKPPEPVVQTPKPDVVLADGKYQVIKKDGKLVFAKADGSAVGTAAGSRVGIAIDEKLTTGKIVPVAIASTAMAFLRDSSGYTPPASAPKPVSPADGKIILGRNPTLNWSEVALAESYRVRVNDSAGELLVDETVATNSLKVPSSLPRGKAYTWRVGARLSASGEWSYSAAERFYVVSGDDSAAIENVKRALPGSHLALGAAYERCGLYEEAAAEYRALRRQNPNSALARKLLYGAAGAGR